MIKFFTLLLFNENYGSSFYAIYFVYAKNDRAHARPLLFENGFNGVGLKLKFARLRRNLDISLGREISAVPIFVSIFRVAVGVGFNLF